METPSRDLTAHDPLGAKSRTHWAGWEVLALLDRVAAGKTPAVAAASLHRTEAAARRMIARLLDGAIPPQLADLAPAMQKPLEALRARRRAEESAARAAALPGPLAETIREQYRTLARATADIRDALAGVEDLAVLALAAMIRRGAITPAEVTRHLKPIASRRVHGAAFSLGLIPRAELTGGLFPQSAAPEADPPLVHTGPEGLPAAPEADPRPPSPT